MRGKFLFGNGNLAVNSGLCYAGAIGNRLWRKVQVQICRRGKFGYVESLAAVNGFKNWNVLSQYLYSACLAISHKIDRFVRVSCFSCASEMLRLKLPSPAVVVFTERLGKKPAAKPETTEPSYTLMPAARLNVPAAGWTAF